MKFLVKKSDDSKRLDIFLSEKIKHLTRSNIKKIIESKNVKINKKIRSLAHGEFNRDDIVNEENIRLKIEKNEDIFGRGYKIKRIAIDESFPKYVLDNKEKLKEWIV